MKNKLILPEPTLRRLPWYLAYVDELRKSGIETVSSTQISKVLNVDSSQIAKDLSFLNLRGKTRIGYEVSQLSDVLTDFLGFRQLHRAVVVGVGSLGSALIQDKGLSNYGLDIIAGFDIDPKLIGTSISNVPIHHVDDLEYFIHKHDAQIGILTVPAKDARQMADFIAEAGINAILNFTPYRIKTSRKIVISNISVYAHLAIIYNRLEGLSE